MFKFIGACKDGFMVGFILSFVPFGFICGKTATNSVLSKIADKLSDAVDVPDNVIQANFGKGDENE